MRYDIMLQIEECDGLCYNPVQFDAEGQPSPMALVNCKDVVWLLNKHIEMLETPPIPVPPFGMGAK